MSSTGNCQPTPTSPDDSALDPGPREECGVFGVWAPGEDVAKLTYYGLYALQHRGQEAAGIALSDGRRTVVFKDLGLVSQVFDEQVLSSLRGHLAVGHVRYSTTGSTTWENAQPTFRTTATGSGIALGHNGNLVNTAELRDEVTLLRNGHGSRGIPASTDSDLICELLAATAAHVGVEEAAIRLLPRLRGGGESMSRQAGGRVAGGGGIGTRGPGETKIETDRRRINTRISRLRRQLGELGATRATQRQERVRHEVPSVVLAGYTNAGKSSLLNRLTGAGVLVEDALFATLDPTVRRSRTPEGRDFTIADTVGFVRHLPHQLVEAFRSTLEEVADADLILHVVDGSDVDPEGQIEAVREVLGEIGATGVPEQLVINKADAADPDILARLRKVAPDAVVVSARTGENMGALEAAVEARLPRPSVEVRALVPYDRGDLVSRVHATGEVIGEEHTGDGTLLTARVSGELAGLLSSYAVADG